MSRKSRKPATKTSAKKGLGEPYFHDSVGKTLQRRRRELKLKYADITKETKIQRRYLELIENGEWQRMPHTVHIIGFIRQYARVLGLDSSIAVTKYLLERGPMATSRTARAPRQRIRSPIVGSRLLIGGGVVLVLAGAVAYLLVQFTVLAAPPALEISAPATDQVVASTTLEVTGKTTSGATVTVNGAQAYVADDGNFKATLTLNPGINLISIEARNVAGKLTKAERSVLVQPN